MEDEQNMSGVRSILKRFQSECETSDEHVDKDLQTHYYKSTSQKVNDAVESLFASDEYQVLSHSKDRGEWTVQKNIRPSLFIVVTIITVRPFETAVDFKVSANGAKLSGTYPVLKGHIQSFYENLDKNLIKI
jgi:hypothetical protein